MEPRRLISDRDGLPGYLIVIDGVHGAVSESKPGVSRYTRTAADLVGVRERGAGV